MIDDWRSSERQHARFLNQRRLQEKWQDAFDKAFLAYRQQGKPEHWAIYLAEHDADDIVLKYASAHPQEKATP